MHVRKRAMSTNTMNNDHAPQYSMKSENIFEHSINKNRYF